MRARIAWLVGFDRHQHPFAPVPADRCVDRAGARLGATVDERKVLASESALGEQPFQRPMDGIALGNDEQPRGVAVEPVDDPGAPGLIAAGAATRRAPARASPCGGPAPDVRRPRRLVDDQQVLVLVRDREWRLWASTGAGRDAVPRRPRSARPARHRMALAPHTTVDRARARSRSCSAPGPASRAARRGSGRASSRPRRRHFELEACAPHRRISLRRPSSTHSRASTPDRDAHVRDVERRPMRELDEVGRPHRWRSGRSGCPARLPISSPVGSHSSALGRPHQEVADQQRERQQREHEHERAAAGEEVERDAGVRTCTRWTREKRCGSPRRPIARSKCLVTQVDGQDDGRSPHAARAEGGAPHPGRRSRAKSH